MRCHNSFFLRLLVLTSIVTLTSCSTTQLPICPKLSRTTVQGDLTSLGQHMENVSSTYRLKVVKLSEFVVRVSGATGNLHRFIEDYPQIVCAFDPGQVGNAGSAYMSCVQHAPSWIYAVRSNQPEELFLSEYRFWENCVAGVAH